MYNCFSRNVDETTKNVNFGVGRRIRDPNNTGIRAITFHGQRLGLFTCLCIAKNKT